MRADFGKLEAMIRAIRNAGARLSKSAPDLAEVLETELKKTASAGTSPDGQVWAPRKDGGRAMPNAGKAISATGSGTTIEATVSGPEALHHKGVRGAPPRPLLPSGSLPPSIAAAFRGVLIKRFREAVKV